MSKKIYKEYFNDWIKAVGEEEQIAVNKNYIWGGRTIADNNEMASCDESCFFGLVTENLLQLKRKPKTQMINGHEVVAPRYDMPEHRTDILIMNCYYEDGIETINFSAKTMKSIAIWGWFDNEKDAIAYANAHRENKND